MDNTTESPSEALTPSGIEAGLDRFPALSHASNAIFRVQPLTAFCVGLALICGATVCIGAVPTRFYGHDIFVPLEMGWRVINGQRPHVDFASGWGPVWFLIAALGLKISRYSVDGIGYANALMALLVGSWSYLLAKNRLLSLWRIVLGLFLAALVAAPYPLGDSPLLSSHAMAYNRYGYALLGLILMECLQRAYPPADDRRAEWTGGISTGAAFSLTLFLKASYFLVGAAMIAAISLLLKRLDHRRFLGMLLGFSIVSACMLGYLRFDLAAMIRDLRMTGAARAEVFTGSAIVDKAFYHPSVLLEVLLFALIAALLFGNRVARWRGLRLPIAGALLFFADFGLILTNAQWDAFPLCAVFAIVIVNDLMQDQQTQRAADASRIRPLYGGALCLGILLFVPQFTSDITGLVYGLWAKEQTPPSDKVVRFTSPNLWPLQLYDGRVPRSNGRVFTTYVNDGVALLERETRPDEKILSMDMTNPFPYALGRRPPHGGIASPTYHFNIDDEHRPSDEQFFGDADIVMVPKRPALDDYYYRDFLRAYEPRIQQRYRLAAESSWWWLYRRR